MVSFSRRGMLKVCAAVGGWSTLASWFPFGNFTTENMLSKPGDDVPETKMTTAKPHIAVIGAGAFGGWTALYLLRRGARVTLVDAWGPGNSRSSSGGETRVLRGMYGRDSLYTGWGARALDLWAEAEAAWGQRLYQPTGVLWMFSGDDGYARASLPCLAAAGLSAVELDVPRPTGG